MLLFKTHFFSRAVNSVDLIKLQALTYAFIYSLKKVFGNREKQRKITGSLRVKKNVLQEKDYILRFSISIRVFRETEICYSPLP